MLDKSKTLVYNLKCYKKRKEMYLHSPDCKRAIGQKPS